MVAVVTIDYITGVGAAYYRQLIERNPALKMKKRLKYLKKAYANWRISFAEANASVQSYFGLLEHCNSHRLFMKLCNDLIFARQEGGYLKS